MKRVLIASLLAAPGFFCQFPGLCPRFPDDRVARGRLDGIALAQADQLEFHQGLEPVFSSVQISGPGGARDFGKPRIAGKEKKWLFPFVDHWRPATITSSGMPLRSTRTRRRVVSASRSSGKMDAPLALVLCRWCFSSAAIILFGSSLFRLNAPRDAPLVGAWPYRAGREYCPRRRSSPR